jgi:hypothetical protein
MLVILFNILNFTEESTQSYFKIEWKINGRLKVF